MMQRLHAVSRRDCLATLMTGLTTGLTLRSPRRGFAADRDAAPANSRLIVRKEKPFNAEPPLEHLLDHWLTDYGTFFQRSHGNVPKIETDGFRLSVEGLVERPLSLSLGQLRETFPEVTAAVTLTCAGNRRGEFPPEKKIPGVQWQAGAISTAEWKGVSLADVLQKAGIKAEAKHVWFEGQDEIVEGGKTISFGGSIPLGKAIVGTRCTPGALLVHAMNNRPLPTEHGAPLRAVVPGYIGARSVKWLGKIVVSDQPSPNHFLAKSYKVVTDGTEAEINSTPPIYEQVLNSAICRWSLSPAKDRLRVAGFALPSGYPECLIRSVEVSVDDGKTWTPARLTSAQREFCWTFWEADLPADAVGKRGLVRATDSRGGSQPRVTPFNLKGYQYNGWHAATLNV
jgi:sulfite oxidase